MSFAAALSQRLREIEDKEEYHEPGWWYPSQLSFCDRSAILAHAGLEQAPKDDRTLRVFWMGNIIHKAMQDLNPFKVIGHELRVRDPQYKVSGRLDTLSVAPDDAVEVQEYKSISSRAFSFGDLPKDDHVLQLAVYLTFPAEGQEKRPDRGRLVYVSKDDLLIKEYLVTLTPEREQQVKERLLQLEAKYQIFLEKGYLPPPLSQQEKVVKGKTTLVDPWQTRYCGYRGTGKCCGDNS